MAVASFMLDGPLQVSRPNVRTSTFHAVRLRDTEVAAFEASPFAEAAVRLRRYGDAAKDPAVATPPLEHYRPALEAALH